MNSVMERFHDLFRYHYYFLLLYNVSKKLDGES